jgi:hypothetical protein
MLAQCILGLVHSARANPKLPLSSCLLCLLSLLLVQQDSQDHEKVHSSVLNNGKLAREPSARQRCR